MSDLQLRARTVSEIVDAAFDLYRRNAARYLAVASLGTIPVLILQIMYPDTITTAEPTEMASMFFGRMFKFAAIMAISAINGAMIIRLGAWDYLGEEPDAGRAVRDVLPRIPSILIATLLRLIAYAFGLLLFLVGALYFYARFFAVDAAIVLEGASVPAAFGRSSTLSDGRKRHILNTLILLGLVYGIFSIGLGIMAGMAGSVAVTLIMQSALSLLATPLFGLVFMLLYYDARIRGEGFDLQRMAAALDTSRPASA